MKLTVKDGSITTKSGMSYRVLALDKYSKHMSLPVLRGIHNLVEHGAVIVGEKPVDTPSLADDDAEFQKVDDQLLGNGTGVHTCWQGESVCRTNRRRRRSRH